jgi:hypothetical protein
MTVTKFAISVLTIYKDDRTDGEFQGEGYCQAKKIRVDACDACEDDFLCFRVNSQEEGVI